MPISISQLPVASSVGGSDLIPIVHNGQTCSTTPTAILSTFGRQGSVTVAADGTPTPVLFAVPFLGSVSQVLFGLEGYSGTDNAALSAPRIVTGTKSPTGFTIVVAGGISGSSVTLHYSASGT